MLWLGTSAPPPELTSLGAPFHHVNFMDLPPPQTVPARHGSPIAYRAWGEGPQTGDAPLVAVVIHGSSAQSASIHPLGKALSAAGIPVYAPDIRGHGSTGTRGDIDYGGLVLMGFSSGGGYALHIAATPLGAQFARAVLLSPMLGPFAPTMRPDQQYARPFVPRIIALLALNRAGIHVFDHLTTLLLAIDPARTDILVGHYSWLLMRAFGTADYAADLRNARVPLAIVAGGDDELFYADRFAATVDAVKPGTPVTLVPGLSHTGLTTDPRAVAAILAAVRGEDQPK